MTVLEHSGTKALWPQRVLSSPYPANVLYWLTDGGLLGAMNVPTQGTMPLADAFAYCAMFCDNQNQVPEQWYDPSTGTARNTAGQRYEDGAQLCTDMVIESQFANFVNGKWSCQFWTGVNTLVDAQDHATFPSYVYQQAWPSPPPLPPLSPPLIPPPASPLVCTHGENMYCVIRADTSYEYAGEEVPLQAGVCEDGLQGAPANVRPGHDCASCGFRCCGNAACTYASFTYFDCACHGLFYPSPPSAPPPSSPSGPAWVSQGSSTEHTSLNSGTNGWSAFASVSTVEDCKTYCLGFTGDDGATCSRITFVTHAEYGNMCWMGLTDATQAAPNDPYTGGPHTGSNGIEAFNYV